jgi:hypothetical protein
MAREREREERRGNKAGGRRVVFVARCCCESLRLAKPRPPLYPPPGCHHCPRHAHSPSKKQSSLALHKKVSFKKKKKARGDQRSSAAAAERSFVRLLFHGSKFFVLHRATRQTSPCRLSSTAVLLCLLGHGVLRDVVDRVGDARDAVGVGVGDLDRKLLLERHDELDDVQGVQAEVLLEAGGGGDLF